MKAKKVLIISTSLRKNGNSCTLAKEFGRGALEAGHDVEFVSLIGKSVNFCIGCYGCFKTGKCFRDDDASDIVMKMRDADVLVFATPIYGNQVSGQMKTLIDRTNPIYPAEYAFREVYLITAQAVEDESAADGAVATVKGFVDNFKKSEYKGVVKGTGMDHVGDAAKDLKVMEAAYKMGLGV